MMFPSTEYLFNDGRTLHEQRFRQLKTMKTAWVHLFISIFFLLLLIGVTFKIHFIHPWYDLSSLYFLQAFFWTLSLIFHYVYTREHWFLKIRGHFKFYKSVKNHTNFMMLMPSFFNVIIIIIEAVESKYEDHAKHYLTLQHYITGGFLIFELIITLLNVCGYIVLLHRFNSIKPIPDIEQNDYFLVSDASSSSEIGYRLNGEATADLLEKQADLIYYLKSSIAELNNKLLNRH